MKKRLQSEEAKKIALSSLGYDYGIKLEDIDLKRDLMTDR